MSFDKPSVSNQNHPLVQRTLSCGRCYGLGYFRATSKEEGGEFAFKCQCSKGMGSRFNFPLWNSNFMKSYVPDWGR